MAKARALDKRRRSIRNIRKITRTMELIATARFKKGMDRAAAAAAYADRMNRIVADVARTGLAVRHPLLAPRAERRRALLLVLTANRGLCGGYNSAVLRAALARRAELLEQFDELAVEVSGKRGAAALRFRGVEMAQRYTHFDDRPAWDDAERLASRYLDDYAAGRLDRVDVAYTRFLSASKQTPVVETLLPLGRLEGAGGDERPAPAGGESMYEFLPSAEAILRELVPASFKIRLFKCLLDAAVSEQIARMVAMKSATENADEMIRTLSMTYNRARQTQITNEILEVVAGAEALQR